MELLNYQQPPVYLQDVDAVRKMYDHDDAFYQAPHQQPVVHHYHQPPPVGHALAVPVAAQPPAQWQPHGYPGYDATAAAAAAAATAAGSSAAAAGTSAGTSGATTTNTAAATTTTAPDGDYPAYQDLYAFHAPANPQSLQPLPGYAHLAAPLTLLSVLGGSQPAPGLLSAAPAAAAAGASQSQFDIGQYPDMTTLVNLNHNIVVPLVELTFVDHKVCLVCGKRITRDMSRHMRTHQAELRFSCKFPKNQCRHKLGKFNRPYDFKKHLLNRHFKFDNLQIKRLHNLSDKLNHWGTCPCGERYTGKEWLSKHILTEDVTKKCRFIE